jgi:hypothetical protein
VTTSAARVPTQGISDKRLTIAALVIFAPAFSQFFGSAIWSGLRLLAGAGAMALSLRTFTNMFSCR